MLIRPLAVSRHRQQQCKLILDPPRPLNRVCRFMTGKSAPSNQIFRQEGYGTPYIAMRQDPKCSPLESVCHVKWFHYGTI